MEKKIDTSKIVGYWKNIKTNGIYRVLINNGIDATNATEGRIMITYQNKRGKIFHREASEFLKKFEYSHVPSFEQPERSKNKFLSDVDKSNSKAGKGTDSE